MLHLLISGANGHMGKTIAACAQNETDMTITAGFDANLTETGGFPVYDSLEKVAETVDTVIDFSRPAALHGLLQFAQDKNCGIVLCTTGYTDNDKMMIAKYAGHVPVFYSANMSLGVNLQIALAKKAAEFLQTRFDIEIIEKHHNQKADAPSGTALAIAEALNASLGGTKKIVYGRHGTDAKRQPDEIGVHAVRGGTVVGEHDVLFFGPDEVIEINHRAHSKKVFAEGALRAARFLAGKPAGLYSMEDLVGSVFEEK